MVPSSSAEARPDLPALDPAALDQAMHLVLPDGHVLAGARALPALLRATGWSLAAVVFRVPGVQSAADRVYRWVANRRHRLGCGPAGCGAGVPSTERQP